MFKGFNLITNEFRTSENFNEYYIAGKKLYKDMEKTIQESLEKYIIKSGESLDGSKIQKDWFPQTKANIFISHSHNDLNLAIGLAGFFYKEFGLIAFIDSCIWGYADTLQETIDKEFCWSDSKKLTYDYTKVKFSTSHVHMMLSTALNMMIDKTECIVFLNTTNSVSSPKDIIANSENKTKSPWIYSEVVMTDLIQTKDLEPKERMNDFTLQKSLNEAYEFAHANLVVEYDMELGHLVAFNDEDLVKMKDMKLKLNSKVTQNLDNLYVMKNIMVRKH